MPESGHLGADLFSEYREKPCIVQTKAIEMVKLRQKPLSPYSIRFTVEEREFLDQISRKEVVRLALT